LKAGIEQKIAAQIGAEKLEVLKAILQADWGLPGE
jgi:hypothetical protein